MVHQHLIILTSLKMVSSMLSFLNWIFPITFCHQIRNGVLNFVSKEFHEILSKLETNIFLGNVGLPVNLDALASDMMGKKFVSMGSQKWS